MKFIVFSDVHIGGKFNEAMFEKGAEYINKIDADYYIFTGDLTDQGTVAEYELAKSKYLPMIKKEFFKIPGNHDVKNVGDLLWEELIGPRFFVHVDEENKVKILGLDSNEPDQNTGRMGPKAIRRIYQEFENLDDEWLKVLVFHHQTLPIRYTGRERSALIDAGDTIQAIMDCNINLVFNGHRHISNVYKLTDGDIKTLIVNCGTMACKKTRYHEQYSITSVEINKKHTKAKVEVLLLLEEKETWNTIFKGSIKEHVIPDDWGKLLTTIILIGNTEFTTGSSFSMENYTKGIQLINSIHCDVVIHTGDITNNSYKNEFEMAKNFLGLITHQMIVVPGPKDYYPLGSELYPKYIGDTESQFENNNIKIFGLDSCILDEKIGRLGRHTSKSIVEELEGIDKLSVIVFHHNLIPISKTKHESELQDAGDVLSRIVTSNINLVITGAKNKSGCWQIDNTVFVNSGTISSKNVNSSKGNSFNIIQVYQTSKGKYYRINEYFIESGDNDLIGDFHIYDKKSPK